MPARDGGRDIVACDILVDDVHWYNIEVKHWRARNVGSTQASACLETAIREGRKGALLISTGGVGPAAMSVRSEAHRDYLRFGEEQKVVLTCKHYVANAAGLWRPIRDFRTFLLDQTV
ncbi:hypothetical protein MMA231_04003 (plasmid) [Asticcacaulis sp. MM231]|uniref:hypothetical protein n=1 Tax=Asticcacaulis sp. MM231 TaxID=3157666 RepID=UPI0032D59865